MLFNYIQHFFRLLRKEKIHYSINILGLTLGFSSFILLSIYINYEFSYDSFHDGAERIFRVENRGATTPVPLVPAVRQSSGAIESATRLMFTTSGTRLVIKHSDGNLFEEDSYFVDAEFFDVFDYKVISGNSNLPMPDKQSVVITERLAQKYFGTSDAAGNLIEFAGSWFQNNPIFKVSAVIANPSPNSQLRFDVLIDYAHHGTYTSDSWTKGDVMSFIKFRENVRIETELESIRKLVASHSDLDAMTLENYELKPLGELHFVKSTTFDFVPRNRIEYLVILSSVALLILIIAAINFINLTTARAADRVREAGLRQIIGAKRSQIIIQLLTESVLIAFLSLLFACMVVYSTTPFFETISGIDFSYAFLAIEKYLPYVLLTPLIIGLLSGLYPSILISSFKPVESLKSQHITGSKSIFRNALVVVQFVISSGLIIGTIVINNQLDFLKGKELGFDKDQLLALNVGGPGVGERIKIIREEFMKHPNIVNVSGSLTLPGDNTYRMTYTADASVDKGKTYEPFVSLFVDPQFITNMGIEFIQGNTFPENLSIDTLNFIINESAVAALVAQNGPEWSNPVGNIIRQVGVVNDELSIVNTGKIIGVVKDFNFESLHHRIQPLVLRVNYNLMYKLLVRIQPNGVTETLSFLEGRWTELVASDRPFNYQFMDDRFAKAYQRDENFEALVKTFALISIVIACIGLYGLVLYVTERNSREISIRKVLGANTSTLVGLSILDFIKPIVLAYMFAIPIIYICMKEWLSQFAYQKEISTGVFIQAAVFTICIAVVTVSLRIIKVSRANPIKYLREK